MISGTERRKLRRSSGDVEYDGVWRGVGCSEDRQRQREGDSKHGSRDRHRQRVEERPQPRLPAREVGWHHFDEELAEGRRPLDQSPGIEKAGDLECSDAHRQHGADEAEPAQPQASFAGQDGRVRQGRPHHFILATSSFRTLAISRRTS